MLKICLVTTAHIATPSPSCSELVCREKTAEKERERRQYARQDTTGSSTPPIPEEPEDDDSDAGYMSGQSPSPPESHLPPPPAMHRQHALPSSSNTRTSSGFREPPVIWHHDGPALAIGGAQYPGTGCSCSCTTLLAHSLGDPPSAVQDKVCCH